MNIEEYLTAYETLRDTVLGMKRAVEKMYAGKNAKSLPVGEMIDFVDYEELEKEYVKKKRILTHATKKLQRTISRISDTRVSSYLICKYICAMTNEDFASNFNYCERQVYRIASNAKKQLAALLHPSVPLPKKTDRGRCYTFEKRKPKKTLRKHGPKARRQNGGL